MLHLVNGHTTAAVFVRAGLPGESAVWRDILMEGPVPARADAPAAMPGRAAYLAERLAIDPEEYCRVAREQEAALARAADHDEMVLWFEQDLFCAINLWFVLARLASRPPARLSLVFPETVAAKGLGAMAPEHLAALCAGRRPLDRGALSAGRTAWEAYASPDPAAVERLLDGNAPLPFLAGAARCHLGCLLSTVDGLNEMERAALAALRDGPLTFAPLFARISADEAVRRQGAGDVQVAGTLREISAGPGPLVAVTSADRALAAWTVALTGSGREVLDGLTDRMMCSPVDRWVGGIRLAPGHPAWRWDGNRVHAA